MSGAKRPLLEPSDETLMARYADGDAVAFDTLFRRHESRVHAFFVRHTGSRDRAQDLYQELFLRIHRARNRYDPERPFAPWLFQIAHRLVVDDRRRAYRAHEVPLGPLEPRAETASSEDRLGDCEALARSLASLSGEEQQILLSSKLGGVGYPELALRLGRSAEAVRKIASRAMQRLRAEVPFAATMPSAGR